MLDYSKRMVRQMDIATSHDASARLVQWTAGMERSWQEAHLRAAHTKHRPRKRPLLITPAALGFQDQHMEQSLVPEGWIGLALRRFCDVCDPVK